MKGPPESQFSGGIFVIKIKIPIDFPFSSPTFKFLTPIYHPNLHRKDYSTMMNSFDWTPGSQNKYNVDVDISINV